MSLKNLPIVIGFAVITSVQFAVGMYMMSLTAREGGEAELLYQESCSHSKGQPAPLRLRFL